MITKKPQNNNIHYEIDIDDDKRYLCNQACSTFEVKRTTDKSKVTCQNCLRTLRRQE